MDDKPKHSSKGLSFIRVLDRDYSKQVQIPQEFTANFNGNVPRRFIIESTVSKKCWRVEIEKDVDDQMYFRGGWHDFVESHSLEVGNFLIFEYEEQSIFRVKVYGGNGCEKTTIMDTKGGHDKLGKTAEFEELEESEAFKCDEKVLRNHQERKRIREHSPKKNKHGIHKKRRAVVKNPSRATKTSITKNGVCFSITLHKRRKHQFIQLAIPMAVSLLKKLRDKEKVTLQNAKGNCWEVKVSHRKDGRGLLSRGWNSFLKENGFVAGDTLNFEFISDNLVQVLATKASQVNQHSEVAKYQNEANRTDEAFRCEPSSTRKGIREFSPKKDKLDILKKQPAVGQKKTKAMKVSISKDSVCFSITLHQQKNYQFKQQEIPKAISSQKKLWNKEKVMLRDAKGNCWPVKIAHRRDGRGIFTQGWKNFLKENGFTAGDTLNFEFISDNIIQVHLTKASQVDHHSEDQAEYQNEATDMLREDDEPVACTTSDDKAIEDLITTKKESSELRNSTFSFTWNEMTTGAYLNIPNEVAEAQNLMNKDTVVFRDPEGKCWPLQVRTWWDGRVVLTKGWVEFWKGHAISEGDSLHLEFMPNSLIQVTIKRGNPIILSATQEADNPEAMDNGKVAQLEEQIS